MRSPPPLPRGEGALRRHRLPPVRNTWAGFEGGVRSPQFFPWDGRSPVSHPTCDVPFPPRRRHAIPTDSLPLSDRQASFGDAENDPRRGRGCIHRTSSTRQSSAAQVARTHFPSFQSFQSFPELPKFKQFHGRNFVAEARAKQYKTITMPCANGNNCPRGGTFKFSPEDQAFNEASFATGGTQEPKRCACTSACVPVSCRCSLDMKYPSTLSPKPEP